MVGMTEKVFFAILIASLDCQESHSPPKRLYKIFPLTETCKVLDYSFVHNYTCRSKNVNRTLNLGSKEIFFKPGVSLTNYHAHVVFYKKFATIYRQSIIDIHFDICALLAGKKTVTTQYFNTERRRKYGNLNDPCPMSGRRYEYNVPFDQTNAGNMPEIFPSGEYRVDSKRYTIVKGEKKFITLTQSYGEVKYTTAEQWKK